MVKRLLLTGFVLLFVFLSGKALANGKSELARADAYYESKNYEKAQGCYENIVTIYFGTYYSLKAQMGLAKIHLILGNQTSADSAIKKLLSDYSDHSGLQEAVFDIASKCRSSKIKRHSKAVELYQYIISKWPNSEGAFSAQKLIAKANLEGGNKDGADKAIEKLKADYADHSKLEESIYELAMTARGRSINRHSKSIELCKYILNRWPGGEYALKSQQLIAKACIGANDLAAFDEAVAILLNVYSSDTRLTKALFDLAECCYSYHKYLKAGQLYQTVLANNPNPEEAMRSQRMLAQVYIKFGNDKEADAVISKLCSAYSAYEELPDYLCNIADCWRKLKKYEKANKYYQYVLDRWPYNKQALRARKNIIKSIVMSGNDAGVDEAVSKLLKDLPKDDSITEVIGGIANSYVESGKYAKALELYQYCLEHWPDKQLDMTSQKHLVISHIRLGDDTKAKEETEKLITNFKNSSSLATAVYQIGEEYYLKALKTKGDKRVIEADFLKALEIWKKLIDGVPASANRLAKTHFSSAVCYDKLGDYANAAKHYEKVVETCPDYEYAWNAQYMAARYYEKLGQTGDISKSEAKTKSTAAYRKLLAKYPNCKAARGVRMKLSK